MKEVIKKLDTRWILWEHETGNTDYPTGHVGLGPGGENDGSDKRDDGRDHDDNDFERQEAERREEDGNNSEDESNDDWNSEEIISLCLIEIIESEAEKDGIPENNIMTVSVGETGSGTVEEKTVKDEAAEIGSIHKNSFYQKGVYSPRDTSTM